MNKNVHTYTFGCKVNLFDTTQLESILTKQGGAVVDHQKKSNPDSVIINTCTVTENADKQANQLIRKVKREHPHAKIVVTGCYAQSKKNEIVSMKEVDHVLGFSDQFQVAERLGWASAQNISLPIVESPRTRANLKIQDGCQAYCSYCILPYVRGKSRSTNLSHVINQAKAYVEAGHFEVVITGTHIAGYGRDLNPRLRFSDLLLALYREFPKLPIRISSMEPAGLTPDFFKALSNIPTIRPHFHIPLQSGHDEILKAMNRKYKTKHYQERIVKLSQTQDRVNIGSDVIVGFPGETNLQFEESCHFIESLPLGYLHVFPYSARPNTASSKRTDNVTAIDKKKRVQTLLAIGLSKKRAFLESFLGETLPVLIEKKRNADGHLKGVTPQYLSVHLKGGDRLMEKEVDVRLTSIQKDPKGEIFVQGEVV